MTPRTADAIVVGGGVVGASAFFHLCAMGVDRVVLIERNQAGAGATGASGAFIQMHFCRNETEVRLTRESLRYFREWDANVGTGACGFQATGYLRLESAERERVLRDRVALLQGFGADTQVISPDDVARLAPYLRADDVAAAAYEPESGFADPQRTVDSFLAAGIGRGGEVSSGVEATRVVTEGGRVIGVETRGGCISAPVVVLATGAWSTPLLRLLGLDLPVTVSLTQWIGFEWADGASHPMLAVGDGVLGSYFRHNGQNESQVLIGLGGGARRVIADPDYQPVVPDETVQEAHVRLVDRLVGSPELQHSGSGAGPITLTPDDLPIIDRHPALDGLSFFVGDGGASFKTAPAIGRALADLALLDRTERVDVTAFRHDRFDNDADTAPEEDE